MVRRIRIDYSIFSLAVLVMVIMACKDEVFYNNNAAPPKEEIIDFVDLKEGQHVDGVVLIHIGPENVSAPITGVTAFLDSTEINDVTNNFDGSYTVAIDTRQSPEGTHTIRIGVSKEKAPEIGLLTLVGYPYLIYSVNVVFDRSPATGVSLVSVEWDNTAKSPALTWTKNNDPNFYAYIIYQKQGSSINEISRIFDRNQLTVHDTTNNQAIGFTYTYYVEASNRYQAIPSNEITFSYPPTINATPDAGAKFVHPIMAKTREVMYVLESNSIKMVSTVTKQVTGFHAMTNKYPNAFALSKDESKLYVIATYMPEFTVLDASTLAVITTTDDLPFNGSELVCGRADRLYATTSYPFNGPVMILDAGNGTVVGTVGVDAPNGMLAMSSDNNTLYVADTRAELYHSATIYKIDVTTDTPQTLLQKAASDWVRGMQLSDDDQDLFVLHDFDYPAPTNNFVDYWDAGTLTSMKKFMIPKQAFDFSANASSVFIISGERTLQYFSPGPVIEYNIATTQVLNTWNFVHAPRLVQASTGNDVVYVYGDSFWYFNL